MENDAHLSRHSHTQPSSPLSSTVSRPPCGRGQQVDTITKILFSSMNRCWMLGTLVFGSFIALARNIRMTLEQVPSMDGHVFFHTVPINEKAYLRRILSGQSDRKTTARFSFIYFDEDALAKERYLYRAGSDEMTSAMDKLLLQANQILLGGQEERVKTNGADNNANNKKNVNSHNPFPSHLIDSEQVGRIVEETTVLGLAYFLTGNAEYAEYAAQLVRSTFLNANTQMAPQALLRANSHVRAHLYQLLDAIKMVQSYLEDEEAPMLRAWFTDYLNFLDPTGREMIISNNYTGLYFDIEDMAVSNFVGDEGRQAQIWKRSLERLAQQIAEDDSMPQELSEPSCEHAQMHTLQGWWTLSRLFTNAMGESLWTAEREALCRASARAIPYLTNRKKCSANEIVDDQRWWPIVVEALRHCPSLLSKRLTWREWMSPNSREVPSDLYSMPLTFPFETGIAPFWNFGMPIKKTETPAQATTIKTITATNRREVQTESNNSKDPPGLHIPAKLAKAAEQDSEMALRVSRIKRWHALGQVDIADRMMKKALKDLKSTKIVWQTKDIIPQAMSDAAKTDKVLLERIGRIRRWHALGQTSIVERMIKKSMDELKLDAEDDAAVQVLSQQAEAAANEKSTLLTAQQQDQKSQSTAPVQDGIPKFVADSGPVPLRPPVSTSSTDATAAALVEAVTGGKTTSRQIPPTLIQQSQNDPDLAKRIHRIQRWKKLGQHEIADKMIQKLLASTEDQLF